jgi:hypothetical protein
MPSSSPYTRTGHRKIRFEHRGKVGLRGKPGRDEYLPIPQAEINLTHGLYVQNNGW